MTHPREINVSTLPFSLHSEGPSAPVEPRQFGGGVTLTAGPYSDMFLDPAGTPSTRDAERFLAEVRGDFIFSAFVSPVFVRDFDSGALIGYVDSENWFKVCAELDTVGVSRIITVVTREGLSDDCDSSPISSNGVFLRMSRMASAFALHASDDGLRWSMVRYFALCGSVPETLKIGILAQSPAGQGTTATFTDFSFSAETLSGVRDGC